MEAQYPHRLVCIIAYGAQALIQLALMKVLMPLYCWICEVLSFGRQPIWPVGELSSFTALQEHCHGQNYSRFEQYSTR